VTLLLLIVAALSVAALLAPGGLPRLPGNDKGYEPVQPIEFSHRLHAGEMGIDCLYCHSSADKSRHAGIPAASTCMNCHKSVRATLGAVRAEDERRATEGVSGTEHGLEETLVGNSAVAQRRIVSPEIAKLYEALALDPETLEPDPERKAKAIEWVQIHKLADFVYFDHSAHVNAGVSCQECHGPVETMERVRQVEDLSMGWCVNCHRGTARNGVNGKPVQPSTDCIVCHY
jgi:hypothetical protein